MKFLPENIFKKSYYTTYRICFLVSIFVLFLQMWGNSGNLSVYAATLTNPHSMHGYITNYDDIHYEMNYKMLRGKYPADEWRFGYTLRRVGMYIAGYPFFLVGGFYYGGEITSFLLVLLSFIILIRFVNRTYGTRAAYAAMLIAGTYTGIMYWIGSPFAQNTIFPICVVVYILMIKLSQPMTLKQAALIWAGIGLLFTGYDLFIMFMPAVFLFYLFQKNWKWALLSALLIFLPQVLVEMILQSVGVHMHNENKDLYALIIRSYFTGFSFPDLWMHIKQLPGILFYNLMDAGFYLLPALFFISYLIGRLRFGFRLSYIERCILMGIACLWLFLNLAPTYESHWQLRGIDIARIYQPVFIVMLMYPVRLIAHRQETKSSTWKLAMPALTLYALCVFALNMGGWYGSEYTQTMYYRFYRHSDPDAYLKNIELYGRRPLGL